MRRSVRSLHILVAIIAFILVIWALRASWLVSMPLTFAVFLTLVLRPLQRRLEGWGLPHWLSVIAAFLALMAFVAGLFAACWVAARQVAQRGPEFAEILRERTSALVVAAQARGLPIGEHAFDPLTTFTQNAGGLLSASMSMLWTVLGVLLLIAFLLLMLMFEAEQWRRKAVRIFENDTAREVLKTVEIITGKLERYLLTRIAVSAMSGVLAGLWCMLLGVQLAFVWAISSFALNFIPNIGSMISFIPPTLFAWLQYDWKWALAVFAALAGTDAIMGNVVDPKMQGKSLRLSPFIILFAVVFWGWVWGIGGMLLAVPITASISIICLHVRGWEPAGRWLSEA